MSPLTITELDLDYALKFCRDRIGRRRSHLVSVAEQLDSPLRRNLFVSCYAAMRVVDDAVDEDHVVGASRSGEETEAYITRWAQQAENAMLGSFVVSEDSIEPEIFFALNKFAGESEIGPTPWRHLGDAMLADVARRGVEDWGAFETYCRGASIAPAEIFLYILSCRIDGERATAASLPRPALYYARDLALFCYLVHIVRDLAKDVRRDENLIVLPSAVLEQVGLADGGLLAAIDTHDAAALRPLVTVLMDRAASHRQRGEKRVQEISTELSPNANGTLASLVGRYVETFENLAADYDAHLEATNWGLAADSES